MIPGFPQIGGLELIILVSIILLFFGAKRIPDLARSLGKGAREFRMGISGGANEEAESKEEGQEKPASVQAVGEGSPRDKETDEAVHAEQQSR